MELDFIKITDAVYKVLNFLPDSDPLKNKAKERVLLILENLTLSKPELLEKTLSDIEVLETYLKLAKYQGWVSDMNFLIITNECSKIKSYIGTLKLAQGDDLKEKKKTNRVDGEARSMAQNLKPEGALNKESSLNKSIEGSGKTSTRQKRILEILLRRDKAQVADIIKKLPDVTKRTIRRDLDDLLKKGKISRAGEWNQVSYQIANQDVSNKKDVKITQSAVIHSLNDLAQVFNYKEGIFANNYNPVLAEKIKDIKLPDEATSIENLENLIKNSLTEEEQALVRDRLNDRMSELRGDIDEVSLVRTI